ncbi:MAG: sulfatase [Verrucomicrobiota bacterium]
MGILGVSVGQDEERWNVLLICVDDLRPELGCYGVEYIESPNIDALAARGRIFDRHYVQAPTCGASRYTLLTGRYGEVGNTALFNRAKAIDAGDEEVPPSMPAWFRENGYTTVSVGKVSHHPGGRGGSDWDDGERLEMPLSWDRHKLPAGAWQHPRGWMHGLAHGEIRKDAKDMDVMQAEEGGDEIYPDGPNTDEALRQLEELAEDEKPFFLAFGIVRPHLPFGAPAKYLEPYRDVELPETPHPEKPEGETTWHKSGEFMKYNRWERDPNEDRAFADEVRRFYAACVSYADAQVGRMLDRLEELGLSENTIVVLWGDHGWHLGEHAVWGKHTLFEESLRSPLIVSYAGIPEPGETTVAMVETLDVFPTLVDLAGLPEADYVDGKSLRPMLESPAEAKGHSAFAYHKQGKTVRTNRYRLIAHGNGHLELYDHHSPAGETENLAEVEPEVAAKLRERIEKRLEGAR